MRLIFLACILSLFAIASITAKKKSKYRKPMKQYPAGHPFWATDFFVRGCKNFLERCPPHYKVQHICARNYNGDFKDFANYCEMEYENCNSWRNWHIYKRETC